MPIGTILTVASLAATAGSAGGSFAQARRARRMKEDAEREAEKAVREARKRGEVNYYDQLAIAKSPYDLEREAMVKSAAQAMEAAREGSQRGVGATAGRLQQYQARGQRDIASRMEAEQQRIAGIKATEGSRLADMMYNLSLEEAAGAQQAAADAQAARTSAMTAGFQSVGSLAGQLAALPALYPNTPNTPVSTVGDQSVDYSMPPAPRTTPTAQPLTGFEGAPLTPREVTATQAPQVMDPTMYSMMAGGAELGLQGQAVRNTASDAARAFGVQAPEAFGAPPEMPSSPQPAVSFPQLTDAQRMAMMAYMGRNQMGLPAGPASLPALPPRAINTYVPPATLQGQTVPFATQSPFAPFYMP